MLQMIFIMQNSENSSVDIKNVNIKEYTNTLI